MKTLKNVGTEMALHVLAYNMKRVISILGVAGLMEALDLPRTLPHLRPRLPVFTQAGPEADIGACLEASARPPSNIDHRRIC
jgi:hypothetical protein